MSRKRFDGTQRVPNPAGQRMATSRNRVWRGAGAGAVPPREGNETRRDGRAGVGAFRSTAEAGERDRADPVEGRGCRIMDSMEGQMTGAPTPEAISTKLHRIATRAREMPGVALRTLAQFIDIAFLREAHRRT